CTRFGWLNRAITCASCRKRFSAIGSAAAEGTSSLIATSRPRPGCSARYTAPMPPRPSSRLITYLPMWRSPGGAAVAWAGGAAGVAGTGLYVGMTRIVAESWPGKVLGGIAPAGADGGGAGGGTFGGGGGGAAGRGGGAECCSPGVAGGPPAGVLAPP